MISNLEYLAAIYLVENLVLIAVAIALRFGTI
jgi:hypothetical protein